MAGLVGKPGEAARGGAQAVKRRIQVRIQGIVQGVGFRPYIYKLANRNRVAGWVRNQADGVEIEASGPDRQVAEFVRAITAKPPPLSRIVDIQLEELTYQELPPFRILESHQSQPRVALISPDVCTCEDCLRELLEPGDRRYRYPFINCTNCGPRYSIIRDIPYDRDKTTMADFAMCDACREEYQDPGNRRFHAQPNACWECGPQVWLETATGGRVAERDDALREAIRQLAQGAIVAIKGLGGFHLAVPATSEDAVTRLRARKVREEKPFAVMFAGLDAIHSHCQVDAGEVLLLQSMQRPIVLLNRRLQPGPESPPIATAVAPRNRLLGSFLPYTPLHTLLFQQAPFKALVMTSGNQSDEPIVTDNDTARTRLRDIADFFLFHDRGIHIVCDDSVTRVVRHRLRPIRRARGYVPMPVFLRESLPEVLGVGAELKNTVCVTRGKEAFLSQHIGDLENLETLRSFEQSISHLQQILHVAPKLIVHDLHPDYLSTQWALRQTGVPRLAVQHHHAHIAAVIAESKISGPVLGLALDGTGYGGDGTIWGGEILKVDGDQCERLGHFRQLRLPGGNMAIREPWRMALSCLWSLNPDGLESEYGDIVARWPEREVRVILQMLRRGINSPLTSSCGRLFDAVAALVGIRDRNVYEGQATIELEQALEPDEISYRGCITKEGDSWILDPLPMVRGVLQDVRGGMAPGIISARFHNGLCDLLSDAAHQVGAENGLQRVALSGGVFQNSTLSQHLEAALEELGFEVHTHQQVPPNDGCIALGQAYIGGIRLQNKQLFTNESTAQPMAATKNSS